MMIDPCPTGWIPEPMKGVERMGVAILSQRGQRVSYLANRMKSNSAISSLMTHGRNWSDKYTILATTNDGKEIAFATLEYGDGMYLITSLQNETSANVFINYQIIENLIYFAVKWLDDKS